MGVHLNHLISSILNPFALGVLGLVLAAVLVCGLRLRKTGQVILICSLLWFWVWSSRAVVARLGYNLESYYPPVALEDVPEADAICVLGGGMKGRNDWHPYSEMNAGADRVWHGARLFKAGKAKKIIISGPGCGASTIPLLVDLGVPREDIICEEAAGNTEEEGRLVGEKARELGGKRILLVTSAWHMRRAYLMFSRCGLEVVPAAADYEFMSDMPSDYSFSWRDYLPDEGSLMASNAILKEYYAFYAYKWLRRY